MHFLEHYFVSMQKFRALVHYISGLGIAIRDCNLSFRDSNSEFGSGIGIERFGRRDLDYNSDRNVTIYLQSVHQSRLQNERKIIQVIG